MRARVYIDGFNLYYGCLKATSYRWLDLATFCQRMLPRDEIEAIKYFTARVQARPGKESAVTDQNLYPRAIATLPEVSVHYGRFLNTEIWAQQVDPPKGGKRVVKQAAPCRCVGRQPVRGAVGRCPRHIQETDRLVAKNAQGPPEGGPASPR